MSETRPTGEQLLFRSTSTGDFVLDAYLEACEKGGRTLPDLLDDIYDNTGKLRSDALQFRIEPTTRILQTRFGVFVDANAGWTDVANGSIFKYRGAYATGTVYASLDIVIHASSTYFCYIAHTSSTSTPDLAKFSLIIDGTQLDGLNTMGTYSLAGRAGTGTLAGITIPTNTLVGRVTGNVGTLDAATVKTLLSLGNVENKTSATIRGELTSGNVTAALGYTPYNSTNPNGYINSITSGMVTAALGYTPLSTNAVSSVAGRTGAVTLGIADITGAAPLASPTLTGVPLTPTAAGGTNNTQIASTAFVQTAVAGVTSTFAPLASPAFTGTPTAPNATLGTNNTQIATTKFVQDTIVSVSSGVVSFNTRTGTVTLLSADVTSALGFTPYNATNPSGYISAITSGMITTALGYTPLAAAPVTSVAGKTGAVALVVADVTGAAPTASPTLTGTPLAPTATFGTNTTQIATTAFVQAATTALSAGTVTSFNGRNGVVNLSSLDVTTALGYTPYNSSNPVGYITGITSGMVTTALGYTPSSFNPAAITTTMSSNVIGSALSFNSTTGSHISFSVAGAHTTHIGTATNFITSGGVTNDDLGLRGNNAVVIAPNSTSERARFTPTGLGIGTTSPSVSLDIVGATDQTARVSRSSGAAVSTVASSSSGYVGTDGSHPLLLGTVGAERVRIDTAGRVGVGTTPNASADLHVTGANNTIRVGGSGASDWAHFGFTGGTDAYVYAPTGRGFKLYTGGSVNFTVDASANATFTGNITAPSFTGTHIGAVQGSLSGSVDIVTGGITLYSGRVTTFFNSDNTNYVALQNTGPTGGSNANLQYNVSGVGPVLNIRSDGQIHAPLGFLGNVSGNATNVSGIVGVPNGGTGAGSAGGARSALGVTATGADTTYCYRSNNLSDVNASSARLNLGIGSMAQRDVTISTSAPSGGVDGDVWLKV